ncbi:MAG: hypothetical protein LAO55_26400 [Acidobacteriia bacterium]|nr:hypothetical protein [Terriglobia bacterium]
MASFAIHQSELLAARTLAQATQLASTQATEAARQAQTALDLATRRKAPREELASLQAAVAQAAGDRELARTKVVETRAALVAATNGFQEFSDPRRNLTQLPDDSPFLLFPVRIETRFHPASVPLRGQAAAAAPAQLWVRIYPDDCSIDTFEPMFSQAELSNVKKYWMGIWRAGGVEGDERGAWKGLVTAHGSGRAGWLADNFKPTNAPPARTDASDLILVIPTATALAAADATAISTYWESAWLADGDAVKRRSAKNALDAAVGAPQADALIAAYTPFNLSDKPTAPATKASVHLSTAFVIFPSDPPTQLQSWSQAPQVRQFPDRFVVLGYSETQQILEALGGPVTLPLYVGPDPSVDAKLHPEDVIHPDGADLFVPDQLKWMTDFDQAVAAGMGLKIDLTAEQAASGFHRLLVIGLQLSTPEDQGPAALQELLEHHHSSRSGLSILPQGIPAHNSRGEGAGFAQGDDSDVSFDDRKNNPLFTPVSDPALKKDGQWLAEFLGIDPAFVGSLHGSDGVDQLQTRAMQTALWPATLGYWMNTLFTPSAGKASIFSDATIAETRAYFTQFVSGRGALPAIRIGGQPYGILPVAAFSRIQWFQQTPNIRGLGAEQRFLGNLYKILRQIDGDWAAMSQNAAYVGNSGDAHQILLNILALHPSSVEYFSRTAESAAQLYNMLSFWALAPEWWQAILNLQLQAQAIALLQKLGYSGPGLPDLLNHFFLKDSPPITTVIDDRPLSETNPIREYTDDHRNYIQWLIDTASTSQSDLLAENGFTDNKSPQALLYLYLRHALSLGYYDASYNYHSSAGFVSADALLAMRTEPAFIHVADAPASESRFAALYKTEIRITGSPTVQVVDFIRERIGLATETASLADQLAALNKLATASTAQLERLFAEHIDLCSYRYDAWLLGLVNQRLASQRAGADGQNGKKGLYLGAYAWVEDLFPSTQSHSVAQIPAELEKQFPGSAPLLTDPAGGGYIHAPSMPQANAAAVLRAGYIAGAKSTSVQNPDLLAVNLSSDRVRVALTLIEGIRNGQSVGALLGYQFERGLHDDHGLAEVDKFIYPLRKAFPLVADGMDSTKTDPNIPIDAIEARNVLDGKKLLDRVRSSGVATYPFGLTTLLGPVSSAEQQALDKETAALINAYDAVADLALAEGVYQAVQGNYDRVASTMEAYTTGAFPPEPGIVQTQPSGIGLTHRFAVQFKPGLPAPAGATPRAEAEPAVDEWLSRMLPPLNQVGCVVTWKDPISGAPQQQPVTLKDLNLRPLDVLYLLKPDDVPAMAELDDRILRYVFLTADPRPDASPQIQYMLAGGADLSMFEAGPLLRSLQTLITQSRPLRASDASRSNDARQSDNSTVFVEKARITTPQGTLTTLANDIAAYLVTLQPWIDDATINRAAILAATDATLAKATDLLERASRFNVPSAGWGFVYAWKQAAFTDLFAQIGALVTRWNQKLTDFDAALTAYAALPGTTSEADRFTALEAAELLIRTSVDPRPATPALLLVSLPAKKSALQTRLAQFGAILNNPTPAFVNLYNAVTALSVSEFDSQPFDVSALGDRAVTVTEDVFRILTGQLAQIQTRLDAVTKQLTLYDAAASPANQVDALEAAAKVLFGDDFQVVPEFTIPAAQGSEWANAVNASTAGDLFTYLKTSLKIDFPVDEWMYGAARVRPVFQSWESAIMLMTAFQITPPELTPMQLPFAAGDPWLALPYPPDYLIDSDRLLYTCIYSLPFNPAVRQCGLMLDEWTEVIPSKTRDTAVTFNYNRPDNEPAQSMLLVASASNTGTWQWADLIGALNETLDLCKKRAVEPAALDPSVYSRFLPGTVMASTSYGISISTSLTAAVGAIEILEKGPNV